MWIWVTDAIGIPIDSSNVKALGCRRFQPGDGPSRGLSVIVKLHTSRRLVWSSGAAAINIPVSWLQQLLLNWLPRTSQPGHRRPSRPARRKNGEKSTWNKILTPRHFFGLYKVDSVNRKKIEQTFEQSTVRYKSSILKLTQEPKVSCFQWW